MDERYFTLDTKDLNFIGSAPYKLSLTIYLSDEELTTSYFERFGSIVLVRNDEEYAFTPEEFINGMNRMTHTATRRIRSHDGIGRCTCSECGGDVDTGDRYCKHCRAEFVGSEYEGER